MRNNNRGKRSEKKGKTVVFVAFEEQDNLGIGYIASAAINAGFQVRIIDFRLGEEAILANLIRLDPISIGFSIIFQHHIDRFRHLISYLRENGISCHFCAGGHYPSLRYGDLLDMIPELDSVVLFEGEITFVELVRALVNEAPWKTIKGIAYRNNGSSVVNALRPLVRDLDRFSPPVRLPLQEYAFGKKFATLLAGRGCVNNCYFCSIREFYSKPPGPVKRIRRPEMVVREMELLHEEKDCSIFLFQDDDFPVMHKKNKDWIENFCNLLVDKKLDRKILWKINCRPDEVNYETFSRLKDHGLFLVYLGIESGTDEGLRRMKKRITVDTNLKAVSILNVLGIRYDYGFMLFEPASTFQSVIDNLTFLERLCGDGSSPVTFCKMLPYAETQVEGALKSEGRLRGLPGNEDYEFLDRSLNLLYDLMAWSFGDWIGDHDGFLNLARWARYYLAVYKKYFPVDVRFMRLERKVCEIIARGNLYFVNAARSMVSLYDRNLSRFETLETKALTLAREVHHTHSGFCKEITPVMNELESLPY